MEAPSSVFYCFRLCVRLVCLPWFCFSSFVPSHPLYFLVFSFVPLCSLFLFFSSFPPVLCFYLRPFCLFSLHVLCLLCSCSSIPLHILFSFFKEKKPPYSQRMPCGYPNNKELMGLLLQKFEILHKVIVTGLNFSHRNSTQYGSLVPTRLRT
ncbi:hypothetical protein NC651_026158 [Populus alba x Populus x berolinensis]|nr:hypothetical protein NC651_026158 [Populus alba x Populus x berolinensis]